MANDTWIDDRVGSVVFPPLLVDRQIDAPGELALEQWVGEPESHAAAGAGNHVVLRDRLLRLVALGVAECVDRDDISQLILKGRGGRVLGTGELAVGG